ncbi:MAG: hypothetical protein IJC26_01530 [Clostridia bacterium]|nr:hypothetical protein [Clostridia bacterium]
MSDVLLLIGLFVFLASLPLLVRSGKLILLKSKLDHRCKKNGAEIIWHRNPFPSALTPQTGFDFTVKAGERIYRVVLLAARNRFTEYRFVSANEVVINKKLSINLIARGRGLRGMGIHNTVDFGLSTKSLPVDLTVEAEKGEEKILLFYPVSKDVTWIAPGKGKVFLGSGDLLYGDFRLFTRSAFLEELASPGKYLRRVNPWEEY